MIRFLLAALLLPVFAMAQPLRWTTYTSTSNVVDLTVTADHIWSVTTGGLSGFDPATGTFDVYTNTDGLAMNNSFVGGRDSRGWIWIAHLNGAISRVDPGTGATRIIDDLRGEVFEFTAILDVGDEVFVAANNGLYRLSYSTISDNYRIFEAIRDLGAFPGEARVADLAVANGYLYAATAFGLARASLGNETLSAPDAWETYTNGNSTLPENDLRALFAESDGTLWIATENVIVQFDGSTFAQVSQTAGVVAFAELNGEVYTATGSNVWRINGTDLIPVGQGLLRITDLLTIGAGINGELIVGMGDIWQSRGGLSFIEADVWTNPIRPDGIGCNFVSELRVDPQGRLWGGGLDASGVFVLDDETATNYIGGQQYPQPFFGTWPNSFAFDDFGGTWAGSEGGGVVWFHGDTITSFNVTDPTGFDVTGPRLTYTSGFVGYVVASVARNRAGDIFVTNRLTQTNKPLVRVQRSWIARGNNSDPWLYYTPAPGSMDPAHREVVRVIVDPYNRVWIGGHERDGTRSWVFDDHGTPADTSDDYPWFGFAPSQYQDPSTCFDEVLTGVTSWDIDHQGYLWIGAHNGAYYTQGGIPLDLNALHFVCVYDLPVGQSVNAIHVDAHDNKWFGTDNGVAVMDKNFTWVHVFQTADADENRSGLASNTVTSITSNPETGDVWIGTTDGLSRLQSPYVSRGGGLSELLPYPNPFTADGAHRMFINHERLGGSFDELHIYTLSGRLVREILWSQAINPSVGWDGRNEDGELVAGGVYLLLVSASDGSSATGKVAVLGK